MRVSWNKTALIDKFLFHPDALNAEEKVLFESYRILDTGFESKIADHKKTVDLILQSGRQELRTEIDSIHHELFHPESKNPLREIIRNIFYK